MTENVKCRRVGYIHSIRPSLACTDYNYASQRLCDHKALWAQKRQEKKRKEDSNKTVTDYFPPEALPSDDRQPGQGNDNNK